MFTHHTIRDGTFHASLGKNDASVSHGAYCAATQVSSLHIAAAPPAQALKRQAAGTAAGVAGRHLQQACGLERRWFPEVLRSDGLDRQLMLVKQDTVLHLVPLMA